MGFLSKGKTLAWADAQKYHAYVKEHGVLQFINIYEKCKDRKNDVFKWGDEVEGIVVKVGAKGNQKTVRVALRAGGPVLSALIKGEQDLIDSGEPCHAHFAPEYGAFMVETTPGSPYGGTTADLRLVEANMRLRRQMIESMLERDERYVTLGSYPLMGLGAFCHPHADPNGPVCKSAAIPDQIIAPHPRFPTLTANIRERRGSNVCIKVPLFQDKYTVKAGEGGDAKENKEVINGVVVDHNREIYMDAMAYGMGCCCLQVTFQARSLKEARHLYDQLAVLSPLFLALTASTPFFHGRISDQDVRWSVISQSVDDRTPEERGDKPIGDTKYRRILKSRYDSIDSYLSLEADFKEKYNDLPLVIDEASFATLKKAGIDDLMAQHVAHLFIRDPLVIYDDRVEIDDTKYADHFENIQSTNWQTVRFKPPPFDDKTGWRVEFRTMELQATDFENAAFTTFIALLSRAILFFNLTLYIPITKVDSNMKTAHQRDAVHSAKFFFRKRIKACAQVDEKDDEDAYEEMSLKEIFCGKGGHVGLIPMVRSYLEIIKCDQPTLKVMDQYLNFIEMRVTGKLMTTATWLRRFVELHPAYAHDSNLNEEIVHDMVETVTAVAHGKIQAACLLGDFSAVAALDEVKDTDGVYLTTSVCSLDFSKGMTCQEMKAFLCKYVRCEPMDGNGATSGSGSGSGSDDQGCGECG